MIQTAKLALSLAVPLLLHAPLLAQQAPDSLGHTAPRLADVVPQFAALNVVDGVLTGAGAGYRARFDRDGLQFVPALGEAAPTEQPVQVRGVAYGRGTADLPLAQVLPSHRGQQVTFAHGKVDTTFVVRNDGIKQAFVFHERPAGRGDLVSCTECEPVDVVASSSSNLSSAIASHASGNETSAARRDALLVWNVDNGTTSAISARRWQPADGLLTTIPSGCGNLVGTPTEECAATGSTGHRAMLRNVAAGATGWLLLSPDRNDAFGCGSCVLVPDLWNCFAFGPLVPNAQGHLTVTTPIPATPLLVGRSYYQQWVVADTATPGCSTFLFDLSNAQQVTIQ
jgi:hypothetical protein